MSSRVLLPGDLISGMVDSPRIGQSPILARSGEGVTFVTPTPVVNQTIAPQVVQNGQLPPTMASMNLPPVETVSVAPPESQKKVCAYDLGFSFNPMMIIVLVFIFLVVFILLYVSKVNMVTDLINGERVINNSKLLFWTTLISIVLAVVALVIMVIVKGRKCA